MTKSDRLHHAVRVAKETLREDNCYCSVGVSSNRLATGDVHWHEHQINLEELVIQILSASYPDDSWDIEMTE